jgi:dTDP-4-dehydrorhamnose 3,5-epimerase
MTVTDTKFEGVKIISNACFYDYRGCFYTSYNETEFKEKVGDYNFIQDNESTSHEGVLRGLHYQTGDFAQAKLVRVIRGSVIDVIVDIRKDSRTFADHLCVELNADNKNQLMIPRGFAHGFISLEDDTIFSYKIDNVYNPLAERGILYNDPYLDINWNQYYTKGLIVSSKDLLLPKFNDFIS